MVEARLMATLTKSKEYIIACVVAGSTNNWTSSRPESLTLWHSTRANLESENNQAGIPGLQSRCEKKKHHSESGGEDRKTTCWFTRRWRRAGGRAR